MVAIVLQLFTSLAFFGLLRLTGNSFQLHDVGDDVFDRGGEVLKWGTERVAAAREGAPLPDAPALYANIRSIQLGFATTMVHQVLLVVAVFALVKQRGLRQLLGAFRMDAYRFEDLFVPVMAVVAMYSMVVGYTWLVDWLDIDALRPQSTVPVAVARDNLALIMAGLLACLMAPLAEEFMFRGVIFGGLLKWGPWPAAALTSLLFSGAHLNLGSLLPFFLVGMVMAWLYWRRGVLWDSIVFHFFFNATSFVALATTR
ncbi:MAG: lysostaphin resistance A-like protein [Dehalococcoidia bacterium]